MDATYSNNPMTCATAEVTRFAVHTPPYKSYNQSVSLTRKIDNPYMGVTAGRVVCQAGDAPFCVCKLL